MSIDPFLDLGSASIPEVSPSKTAPPSIRDCHDIVVSVYLDDGLVFEYDLPAGAGYQAREHAAAIVRGGYRRVDAHGVLTHFPPHRILKVKATGQATSYPDRVRGT